MDSQFENDSINIWISRSGDSNLSMVLRKMYLNKAYVLLKKENPDTIQKGLFQIADEYYKINDLEKFNQLTDELYPISISKNDTNSIAEYHWNKGLYYGKKEILDSCYQHYFQARDLYRRLGNKYFEAKMLYNMSYALFRIKNYVKSEILLYEAIHGFEKLNKNRNLYLCYNRLVLIEKELGNYDKALDYHNKGQFYLRIFDSSGRYRETSLNNLSLVYQKQGLYKQAIQALDQALENKELYKQDPNLYSKVIDNRAYYRFLKGDSLDVFKDYKRALAIKQELNNEAAEAISRLRMAEYYLRYQDSSKAYQEAYKAYQITSRLHLNRDILESLKLLSRARPEQAHEYLTRYASLNDSLILEERKVRDKFTRVQFETENYIAKNQALEQKNIWISISSAMALASLSLIFLVYRQKSRNRRLKLERKQQKANEEIYDLMIKQQYKREEGRLEERVRISEELHDGALARLFSVRMGMGFTDSADPESKAEQHQVFMDELKMVEKEIRAISHALKNEEHSTKKDFSLLLENLLEEQSKLGGFNGNLIHEQEIAWDLVDEKIKINLFRIVQEALHNMIKYAECQQAAIRFFIEDEWMEMEITDDGKGFKTGKKSRGIGLKNMRSRTRAIGAEFLIWSEPGKGSRITIRIPTNTLYNDAEE